MLQNLLFTLGGLLTCWASGSRESIILGRQSISRIGSTIISTCRKSRKISQQFRHYSKEILQNRQITYWVHTTCIIARTSRMDFTVLVPILLQGCWAVVPLLTFIEWIRSKICSKFVRKQCQGRWKYSNMEAENQLQATPAQDYHMQDACRTLESVNALLM